MDESARYLVGELERLLSLPIGTPQELEVWYSESERIQQEFPARFPDSNYPHDVWHFLTDADIRVRDAGYREYQERIITDYIRRVRNDDAVA